MSYPNASLPVAAWYPDPTDPTALRWWDGLGWTPHVTSRAQQAYAAAPDPRFTDPRYQNPPVIDESRALPTLASAAQANAGPAPLPTAVPTAAPSYEPAYVPSGGYQAAYLSAHPEADLSPRPGAYQQAAQQAPGGQPAYPAAAAALPSDIPTQYTVPQPPAARPETEPIDYPSVMDGYPHPGQSGANDPGPMAASLHANRTAPQVPQATQPVPGQFDSYPPPAGPAQQQGSYVAPQQPPQQAPMQQMPAPAPQPSATEFTASLLSQAPPPTIAALLGHQPPQAALSAAPAPNADLSRRAAAQLASAEQLSQQNDAADRAAAYRVVADKAIADKAAFEAAAAQAAAERAVTAEQADQAAARLTSPATSSNPTAGQEFLPEPTAQGGFTEGYQAGFRAALEGKAQVAVSEKRSREVDPNAEPVPLAGLDPANQTRPRALDPKSDPVIAPMHRG